MTATKITVAAPCKVNLTLDIGPRRADGYHDLDSVVVPLSPADEVTVTLRPGAGNVKLIVKDRRPDAIAVEPMPRGAENIAHRAGRIFADRVLAGQSVDVWINLAKRLPAQAGIGGGSSDAAATLRALAALSPTAMSPEALHEMAVQLGSDVALFLHDGPVRMRGRGERIEPLATPLPPLWGVLVRPAEGIPTGPAYALLDSLEGRRAGEATARLLAALSPSPTTVEAIAEAMGNDFEDAVLPAFPSVRAAHDAVRRAGARRALLCGSGSAVFGLANDREHAIAMVKELAGAVAWVKLARSLP